MVTPLTVDVAFVVAGVAGLWLGAGQFVAGASRLAGRLGVSGLVVGLTVVSFGTSAPEFAVTVDAAVSGRAAISVGNVVGSNVVNLGFVLGGTALVGQLPVAPALVRRDGAIMIGTVLALIVVVRDFTVTRIEGAALFALLVAYVVVLARTDEAPPSAAVDPGEFHRTDMLRLVGGLTVVIVAAHALVLGAADLAVDLGVSEWVVGVTVVALGTSTPELVTSVAAATRGRVSLAAGNVVGSCIINVLGVLGVAGVAAPLPVGPEGVEGTIWLLGISVVATLLLWTRELLTRWEGALLVALNVADWLQTLLRP
ncbi:calcium/sodium antiporter [Halosimplex sp. J119]